MTQTRDARTGTDATPHLPGWAAAAIGVLAAAFVLVSLYPQACDDAGSRCTTWVGIVIEGENTTLPVLLAVAVGVTLWVVLRALPLRAAIGVRIALLVIGALVVWLVWFPQPLSGQDLIDKCAAEGKVPHVDGGGGCMYPPGTELP